jgi:hypothetical protein
VLRDCRSYRELRGTHFEHLNPARLTRYYTKRVTALGCADTLTTSAARSATTLDVKSARRIGRSLDLTSWRWLHEAA